MKNIALALAAVFTLLVAQTSTASAEFYTSAAVPVDLHIYSSTGSAYVRLPKTGCLRNDNVYELRRSHKGFEQIFSLLLAAKLAGTQVRARIKSCNEQGTRGYLEGVYLP